MPQRTGGGLLLRLTFFAAVLHGSDDNGCMVDMQKLGTALTPTVKFISLSVTVLSSQETMIFHDDYINDVLNEIHGTQLNEDPADNSVRTNNEDDRCTDDIETELMEFTFMREKLPMTINPKNSD
jgi:hypothetical protein